MHRAIDRFTDSHSTFRDGRNLLAPSRSRFAGIIIDIFYDHYLCIHWKQFSKIPLAEFTQQVYQTLEENPHWHAGRLADIFPSMKATDSLMNYGNIEGIELTLQRMSQRSPRVSGIAEGIIDLRKNYSAFEALFLNFMPDLIYFAEEWKKENPSVA